MISRFTEILHQILRRYGTDRVKEVISLLDAELQAFSNQATAESRLATKKLLCRDQKETILNLKNIRHADTSEFLDYLEAIAQATSDFLNHKTVYYSEHPLEKLGVAGQGNDERIAAPGTTVPVVLELANYGEEGNRDYFHFGMLMRDIICNKRTQNLVMQRPKIVDIFQSFMMSVIPADLLDDYDHSTTLDEIYATKRKIKGLGLFGNRVHFLNWLMIRNPDIDFNAVVRWGDIKLAANDYLEMLATGIYKKVRIEVLMEIEDNFVTHLKPGEQFNLVDLKEVFIQSINRKYYTEQIRYCYESIFQNMLEYKNLFQYESWPLGFLISRSDVDPARKVFSAAMLPEDMCHYHSYFNMYKKLGRACVYLQDGQTEQAISIFNEFFEKIEAVICANDCNDISKYSDVIFGCLPRIGAIYETVINRNDEVAYKVTEAIDDHVFKRLSQGQIPKTQQRREMLAKYLAYNAKKNMHLLIFVMIFHESTNHEDFDSLTVLESKQSDKSEFNIKAQGVLYSQFILELTLIYYFALVNRFQTKTPIFKQCS